MTNSPAEQLNSEAELLPAGHANIITEANWEEMKAKGFRILIEQVDLSTPGGQKVLKGCQEDYGREYIYTGAAFEWNERRPLDNKPGHGLYNTKEGVIRFANEGYADERQSSPDTGPASS
jgi:hypothetical protein